MKQIFKGIVNGETFNSVEEYNARIGELLEAGEEISASTNTSIVSEVENDESDYICEIPIDEYLVLMDNTGSLYIPDHSDDISDLEAIKNTFEDIAPKLFKSIKKMPIERLNLLKDRYDEIILSIKKIKNNLNDEGEMLYDQKKEIEDRIADVNKDINNINEFNKIYTSVKNFVDAMITINKFN